MKAVTPIKLLKKLLKKLLLTDWFLGLFASTILQDKLQKLSPSHKSSLQSIKVTG
jgi:hypothetical protein